MNRDDRIEYVRYRLQSAHETYAASKVLFENGFYNSCINRLYYAVFYAVNALLVLNKIQPKTHSTVKSQFSLQFVKTGKFDASYGRLLNTLYDWRQRGDYENLFTYDKEAVEPMLFSALTMIKEIEKAVNHSINTSEE